jgi:hypothetical protein
MNFAHYLQRPPAARAGAAAIASHIVAARRQCLTNLGNAALTGGFRRGAANPSLCASFHQCARNG